MTCKLKSKWRICPTRMCACCCDVTNIRPCRSPGIFISLYQLMLLQHFLAIRTVLFAQKNPGLCRSSQSNYWYCILSFSKVSLWEVIYSKEICRRLGRDCGWDWGKFEQWGRRLLQLPLCYGAGISVPNFPKKITSPTMYQDIWSPHLSKK